MLVPLLLAGLASAQGPRVGPPTPHLAADPSAQLRLSGLPAAQALFDRYGPGVGLTFDPRTGAPRFASLPGLPMREAPGLAAALARAAGVDPAELVALPDHVDGARVVHRWARRWRGAAVIGDEIAIYALHGRLQGAWIRLHPVPAGLPQPRAGEAVLPLPTWKVGRPWVDPAEGVAVHLVTTAEADGVFTHRDRAGRVVDQWTDRRHAEVQIAALERTVGDARVAGPARQVTVTDLSGAVAVTADDGSHGLTGDLTVELDGPTLQVLTNGAPVRVPGSPDGAHVITLTGGTDITDAAASVQTHFHVVWDWLADRWPSHAWLAEKVPANVDITSGSCNAWYTGGTINFLVGSGGRCHNYGQIADVIYHEVGHGIHHYILASGTFAGDISEGSADFVSATLLDSATVGQNANPAGGYIRELESDRVYPRDVIGQVHNDGLIWGSFWWNLRQQWAASMGEAAGVEAVDLLFLGALSQGPSLTDAGEAVVLADDDDGDLSNGTPHGCELGELLDQHGLGAGPLGVIRLDHAPLGPQASEARGYPVQFTIDNPLSACSDWDPEATRVWFHVGVPLGAPGVPAGDGVDPAAGWVELRPDHIGRAFFTEIPRQLAEAEVFYTIEVGTADGAAQAWSHGGSLSGLWRFQVGDREALWCEGFEGGPGPFTSSGDPTDEWAVATPVGGAYVPDAAHTGVSAYGTNLLGKYLPNNRQQARVSIDLSGVTPEDRMLQLSYQRWLTVEDGIYDVAAITFNGREVWRNPSTDGGQAHTLDTGWAVHDLPLGESALDEVVEVEWSLRTDPGLEFGGWALDEVCLTRLADLPGHYARVGLEAVEVDGGLELRWENPWIAPLGGVHLRRAADAFPSSAADGDVIFDALSPAPGAPMVVLEPALEPGEVRHYVLFTEDGLGLEVGVFEGDNAVRVEEALPPEDTGDSGEPDAPDPEPEPDDPAPDTAAPADAADPAAPKDAGCGCASPARPGPAGGLAALLGGLGLLLRRRRR
jgi:MYXO-CTERM domain-containing protein